MCVCVLRMKLSPAKIVFHSIWFRNFMNGLSWLQICGTICRSACDVLSRILWNKISLLIQSSFNMQRPNATSTSIETMGKIALNFICISFFVALFDFHLKMHCNSNVHTNSQWVKALWQVWLKWTNMHNRA